MGRRGQALVEFVLILPIFLFLIFVVYDFGRIFNTRNTLENDSNDIIMLYSSGKTIDEINNIYSDIDISMSLIDDYYEIVITDSVKTVTPGLNRVFGNPYVITVVRYVPYEQ